LRIIAEKTLRACGDRYPDCRQQLKAWVLIVRRASWGSIIDVRAVFPAADAVKVGTGRIATIFNVCGNKYRLITAIHYNTGLIFILRFLTHSEYSKDAWKENL
jgi:mRNA interferase HigB